MTKMGDTRRDEVEATEEERAAMQSCIAEAFWYRSMPSALVTGSGVLWAVKRGKLRPNRWLGPWAQVAGFGSLAYILGKLSYIAGENCMEIFLKEAPNSNISVLEREKRDQLTDSSQYSQLFRDSRENRRNFGEILTRFDEGKMSPQEKVLLQDCNTVALYFYCIPASVVSCLTLYVLMRKGYISQSQRLIRFPKLPKLMLGGCLGYLMGHMAYVVSGDCSLRFTLYDPDGNVAKLLRGELDIETEEVTTEGYIEEYMLPNAEEKLLKINVQKSLEVNSFK